MMANKLEQFRQKMKEVGSSEIAEHCYFLGDTEAPLEIVVSVGIHGDEVAGIEAVLRVINSYGYNIAHSEKKVAFVLGNPRAISLNRRFSDIDLNRCFGSEQGNKYENIRASVLLSAIQNTQYLLDIHQTIEPTSRPFGIFPNDLRSIDFFRSLKVIEDVVLTDIQKSVYGGYSFDEYMISKKSAVAVTAEVGSISNPVSSVRIAEDLIIGALQYLQIIPGHVSSVPELNFWKQKQKIPNGKNLVLVDGFINFDSVKKGQVLAFDGEIPVTAYHDGIILFPKYAATTDMYVMRIAENVK